MDAGVIAAPPPIHPDDLGRPPPGTILLDLHGYFSDRTNATTAEGYTESRKRIKVTFWAAHPPRGSCFTVYIPGMEPSSFGSVPKILCTEQDLALLRVPNTPPGQFYPHMRNYDHFVYKAGTDDKRPSLDLIPRPPSIDLADNDAGLLRRRDRDTYSVVVLRRASSAGQFHLHLYSSETGTWSTKPMHHEEPPHELIYTYPSKVITIGGDLGSVGWVDLWRGILICDVLLDDNTELRFIPLPLPLLRNRPLGGAPLLVRDIIVFEDYIKYFEMHLHTEADGDDVQGWEAATWRRKKDSSGKKWKKYRRINVVSEEEEAGPKEIEKPTLKGQRSGFPALSLHDGDVVYIMDRKSLRHEEALVIAVDMKRHTLEGVVHFCTGRPLGYGYAYRGSDISKYLITTSSTTRDAAAETSKDGIGQQGKPVSGMGAQPQLRSKVKGESRKSRGRRGHCK